MKIAFGLIISGVVSFGALPLMHGQCPQSCGDNWNTSFGVTVTTGVENTVIGTQGLFFNVNGGQNTVVGAYAGYGIVGGGNTAIGDKTLNNNFSGDENTALGYGALSYCEGSNNIGIGAVGGTKVTTGNDNIEIGNQGTADDNRVIRLGNIRTQRNTYIAGISGVTVAGGVGVVIDTNGHLGTVVSSERFKDGIKPMDNVSNAILALQPVTFHYKKDLDPKGVPQFGLVAEQVEKVNPDLVARDEQGKPYTVRYEAVNAMLLNEFLKEHRTVETQDGRIKEQEAATAEMKRTTAKQATTITDLNAVVAQQQKEIQHLTEALKAQAEQIQKVSEQLQTQVAPRVVVNK